MVKKVVNAPAMDASHQAELREMTRMRHYLHLLSDWAWETNQDHQFVNLIVFGDAAFDATPFLHHTFWQLGSTPVEDEGSWEHFRARLEARLPIENFTSRYTRDGSVRYIRSTGVPVWDEYGDFIGYRGTSKDVTETARNERLLKLEHAITYALAVATDIQSVIMAALKALCEIEDWHTGSFWRADAAGVLRLQDFYSLPNTDPAITEYFDRARGTLVAPANGLVSRAYHADQPLWIPDLNKEPDAPHRERADAAGLRGTLLFQLRREKVFGVFAFASPKVRKPDDALLDSIAVITAQMGQFLQRQHAEQVLRESEENLGYLLRMSTDWHWRSGVDNKLVEISGRQLETTQNFVGRTRWDESLNCDVVDGSWEAHQAVIRAHLPFENLIVRYTNPADGSHQYSEVSGEPIFGVNHEYLGYRGVARDITARVAAEKRIVYLANHDALTTLPNRSLFSEILNNTIHTSQRYNKQFAVLFIDLDRFKQINDTLGHEAGDKLLQEVSTRLSQTLRPSDWVARLGGDEFVILLPEISENEAVATVARKLLKAIGQPMTIGGQEIRVTGSIGISLFPTDASDEHGLTKNADIAMYRAKEDGKNAFRFYSEDIRTQTLERLMLEASLRHAVERQEFALHYQAKLDLKTDQITGMEALLRWHHPDLGLVMPTQFIPLAEETGLIVPIGKWVLATACAQNMAWKRAGLPALCMAVNLSARQFADENLLTDIASALHDSGMDANLLELELTESMVMQNHERAMGVLAQIKQLGVRLAIDDFGTGYSSLAQMKNFPINTLKVDRSFIRDLPENAGDQAIARAIIEMARTLGFTVVAEGVETEAQQESLRGMACDETQGYYFSRPITPDAFETMFYAHSPNPKGKHGTGAAKHIRSVK